MGMMGYLFVNQSKTFCIFLDKPFLDVHISNIRIENLLKIGSVHKPSRKNEPIFHSRPEIPSNRPGQQCRNVVRKSSRSRAAARPVVDVRVACRSSRSVGRWIWPWHRSRATFAAARPSAAESSAARSPPIKIETERPFYARAAAFRDSARRPRLPESNPLPRIAVRAALSNEEIHSADIGT